MYAAEIRPATIQTRIIFGNNRGADSEEVGTHIRDHMLHSQEIQKFCNIEDIGEWWYEDVTNRMAEDRSVKIIRDGRPIGRRYP